jgi:hypothetical protein
VETNDYIYALQIEQQKPVKPPTQTVVEVHQPQLVPPNPKETADQQHIPGPVAGADEVESIGVNVASNIIVV